ncbi:hypothetical protein DP73_11330 [Desulfosporosinus sp. HMP52]|nr:hypothetical protein DP73_11330 [Desulfosporosinus sp. HMP52]
MLFSSDYTSRSTVIVKLAKFRCEKCITVLLVLACPLGHLLMMKFMVNNHKHQKEEMEEKRKGIEVLN